MNAEHVTRAGPSRHIFRRGLRAPAPSLRLSRGLFQAHPDLDAALCSGNATETIKRQKKEGRDGQDPSVAPQVHQAAVLLVDIVDFTRLVEGMAPERVFALLRSFHRRACDVVFRYRGHVEKYIGDAILVTFGTSLPSDMNATNALLCAHGILQEVERWNEKRAARGAANVRVGIGVHYGPVATGDIGDERRRESTVIGDVVNVASRIERLTRHFNAPLIVSGDLIDATRREGSRARELLKAFVACGLTTVRGRRKPISIWIYKKREGRAGTAW